MIFLIVVIYHLDETPINGIYTMTDCKKLWNVSLKRSVIKEISYLPHGVKDSLLTLVREIEIYGPVRGNWPNYSKLPNRRHHCHLGKSKPPYVAVWEVKRN